MTPSIFHISSIYLWSMKIPNREFSHQPYKASSVVTSHGQLDHFTCICRSNMCGCGYVCHMMQARTKPRSVMMSNLNQKHHHTTTATCVCLVYNTQTQSLSDPGWQSLQASNTWRQLNVMPSTITAELMFECIHPWKLPNKAWWQAMLTPSFFVAQSGRVSKVLCLRAPYVPAWQHLGIASTRSIEKKGHSSRRHFVFCRRSRSAEQDTDVLLAGKIEKKMQSFKMQRSKIRLLYKCFVAAIVWKVSPNRYCQPGLYPSKRLHRRLLPHRTLKTHAYRCFSKTCNQQRHRFQWLAPSKGW